MEISSSLRGTHNLSDATQWIDGNPAVLVFDVNETLIDFEAMAPVFDGVGRRGAQAGHADDACTP